MKIKGSKYGARETEQESIKVAKFKKKRGPLILDKNAKAYTDLWAIAIKNLYGIEFMVLTPKKENLTRLWNNALVAGQVDLKLAVKVAVVQNDKLNPDIEGLI